MHPRVSVSQICSWNWSLEQDLTFYARTGIDQVGLHQRKLDAHGRDAAVEAVRAADLHVTNLIAAAPMRVARPDDWDRQRERLLDLGDLAARCGADLLCTTTGPADGLPWDEAADAMTELLRPVLGEVPVPLVLEHTNGFRVDLSFLLSLRDAVDLARRAGVQVLVETNACWSERGLAATARDGIDVIALIQVSDFVIGTKCTPDRAVPGDGDIPWERVLGAFEDAGYGGFYDLELIGPRIEEEGYASALPRSVENLAAIVDRLA